MAVEIIWYIMAVAMDVMKEFGFEWEEVYPGYRGNYIESSLIHFKLKDKLMAWDETGKQVIDSIRRINSTFS